MGRIRFREVIEITAADLPAAFTPSDAARAGVSRRGLKHLLASGFAEQVARGLYRRADSEPADYDLIEVAVKARRPTLCLMSALARHELTDIIPAAHDVAVPRGDWRPVVSAPVRWHKFDVATFEIGRDAVWLDETHCLGLYSAARSIVDAFRLRHEVGADVANEALRRWLRRGGKPADLLRMINDFPAARSALLGALQILS